MSLILADSFDDGLVGQKWTQLFFLIGGGYNGSVVRTGSRSLALHEGYVRHAVNVPERHATFVTGFGIHHYNMFESPPRKIMNFFDSGVVQGSLVVDGNGALVVYRGDVATEIGRTNNGLMTNGVWYYIEMKWTMNATTGRCVVKMNGGPPIIDYTGNTVVGGGAGTLSEVTVGGYNVTWNKSYFYIDDFYLINGAGTVNNDFLGDIQIRAINPSGNGTFSQFIGSDGNSVDNYLLVDEVPDPSSTDYVESPTPGNIDTYVFSDIPAAGNTVKAVIVRPYLAKSDAGALSARTITRIGTTNYTGADITLGTAYSGLDRTVYENSPATSNPWTPTEVNAAEFGIEVRP